MAQVQPQCSVYFCIKIFFKSWLFWLIWPFECLILMILTMTNYQKNLLRDNPLSLLFIVKFFSSLETKIVVKIPNETFLKITQYQVHRKLFAWVVDVARSTPGSHLSSQSSKVIPGIYIANFHWFYILLFWNWAWAIIVKAPKALIPYF